MSTKISRYSASLGYLAARGCQALQGASASPRLDAEVLLAYTAGISRSVVFAFSERTIRPEMECRYFDLIAKRVNGMLVAQLVGKKEFYSLEFAVTADTLVPRPETELLVEKALGWIPEKAKMSILDIGTGTGCIAITAEIENLADNIFATDISESSIEIAKENMVLHHVENIQFARHDFLRQNFKSNFDVVVSNPPYIAVNEMNALQTEVKDYDPPSALTDYGDGLTFYRHFSEQFDNLLKLDGYLLLEIGGGDQQDAVESIFQNAGLNTEFFKDLQQDWRMVEVRR